MNNNVSPNMPQNNGMINTPGMNNNSAQMNREAYYRDNSNNNLNTSSNKNDNKKIIFIIIGGVLIALIIGVLIYVGVTNKKKKTEAMIKESIQESYIEDSMISADDGTVGKDFKLYRVKIKDKRVNIPISYKNLSKLTSASLKTAYDATLLPAESYKSVNLYTDDDRLALYIDVYNPKEVDIKYPETNVTRVSQIKSMVTTYGAVPITFPGELQVGMNMTEESIINLFGETNHKKTVNNNGYVTSTFKYVAKEDDLKSNFFEIELVNGVVTELTLDHRG